MRILLGVNDAGQNRKVIRLLARLQFPSNTVDAVHVVETLQFPGRRELPEPVWDAIDLAQQRRHEAGAQLAEQAVCDLHAAGLRGASHCLRGLAADRLIDYADEVGADLIVVGSERKSPTEAFFEGSISRGLVIGARRSILVVKHDPAPQGPLTVVLATDHSVYMSCCLDKLAEMCPAGIQRLIIMTAYEINREDIASVQAHDPDLASEWVREFEEHLHERNRAICARMRTLGTSCETRVLDGPPIPAINSVMEETGAELLIMGAQGHGFVERLTMGSLSFHEVTAEPHSVLILRA